MTDNKFECDIFEIDSEIKDSYINIHFRNLEGLYLLDNTFGYKSSIRLLTEIEIIKTMVLKIYVSAVNMDKDELEKTKSNLNEMVEIIFKTSNNIFDQQSKENEV
jgi:hypothetical protein